MLDAEASKIDLQNSKAYTDLPDIAVSQWLAYQGMDDATRSMLRHFVSALVGREPEDVGMHYLLDYIKAGGGFWSLSLEGELGAQSLKIKEGECEDRTASEIAIPIIFGSSF